MNKLPGVTHREVDQQFTVLIGVGTPRRLTPNGGDRVLSALAGTFMEAEIGIKANAAVHSRCLR